MPAAFTTKIKKFKKKSKRQALGYDATNTPNINVFGVEKRHTTYRDYQLFYRMKLLKNEVIEKYSPYNSSTWVVPKKDLDESVKPKSI